MLEHVPTVLIQLLTIENFIYANIGVMVGIIFGAIPGLNGNLAITILLPFTFALNPVSAILMLTAIFFGSNFGGSISSILINTPGTNAAAATLLDGYPLAQKGYPRKSLDMALVASTVGGIISSFILLFFAPPIANVAIRFGPAEYFSLAIFGLSIIASVSGKSIVRGMVSGCIGVLISTVGVDLVSGVSRFTFGSINLYRGIPLLPVILGVYAISNMIDRINLKGLSNNITENITTDKHQDRLTVKDILQTSTTMFKSSIIGVIIGAIPGTGGAIASFIAYNEAKRCAKKGEKFGEGEIKGVAAPESANNGATSATLIPLLTLGIPGDLVAATLLGGFIMHGLIPGPTLFKEQGDIMYAIMIGMLCSNILIYFQGKYLLKYFVKITKIPQNLLTPILVVICTTGAFAYASMFFDLYLLMVFGIGAYILSKMDFPVIPVVLGIILGPIAENNVRSALNISGGSLLIFIQKPISLFFLILTVVFIILLKRQMKKETVK